ncbi:MAG: endonuclease/exonuclease/phosphatase family protein [Acidimicrobiales bacterium]
MATRKTATLATFNTHGAMDGWGREFDLAAACRTLDADVIVLEEVFAPLEGPSQAEEAALALGYRCVELRLARALRRCQPLEVGPGWGPHRPFSSQELPLIIGSRATRAAPKLKGRYENGSWGIAILSRLAVAETRSIELGHLKRDVTRRAALVVEVVPETRPAPDRERPAPDRERPLVVVGTHAAHLSHGSLVHFAKLARLLPPRSVPAVLAGDMNLWGPPLGVILKGWRRAAKGPTWPARFSHSQLDHILVTSKVEVIKGGVVNTGRSDHRALRAELAWS